MRMFPPNAIKVTPKGLNCVIALYGQDEHGRCNALAYSGKRSKTDWRYRFRSIAERDQHIASYIAGLRAAESRKADYRSRRVLSSNPCKVGDIFYSSWGYDQTNIDFYQVTDVKGQYIVIREIRSRCVERDGYQMTGSVVADPDNFKGDPIRKKVKTNDNGQSVFLTLNSYANAWTWDGKPKHYTAYA